MLFATDSHYYKSVLKSTTTTTKSMPQPECYTVIIKFPLKSIESIILNLASLAFLTKGQNIDTGFCQNVTQLPSSLLPSRISVLIRNPMSTSCFLYISACVLASRTGAAAAPGIIMSRFPQMWSLFSSKWVCYSSTTMILRLFRTDTSGGNSSGSLHVSLLLS